MRCQGKMRRGKHWCVIAQKFEQLIPSFCAQMIHTQVVYTCLPEVNVHVGKQLLLRLCVCVSFLFNAGVKYVQSSQNSKEACLISVVFLWDRASSALVTANKKHLWLRATSCIYKTRSLYLNQLKFGSAQWGLTVELHKVIFLIFPNKACFDWNIWIEERGKKWFIR